MVNVGGKFCVMLNTKSPTTHLGSIVELYRLT